MADIEVSVGLPPSAESAQHVAAAEKLGYRRAYLFDTPFEGDDVWVGLHRAAEGTSTIELGPGVLIPTRHHPRGAAPTAGRRRSGGIAAPPRPWARFCRIRNGLFQSGGHRSATHSVVLYGVLHTCLPGAVGRRVG